MLIEHTGVAQPVTKSLKKEHIKVFQCSLSIRGLRNPVVFLPLVSAGLKGVNSGCPHFCKLTCVQIMNIKSTILFTLSETRSTFEFRAFTVDITDIRMFFHPQILFGHPNHKATVSKNPMFRKRVMQHWM